MPASCSSGPFPVPNGWQAWWRVTSVASPWPAWTPSTTPGPWSAIPAVHKVSTVQVPDDAYLLVEGDRPRDHLPTLFLALAVAVFGVVNLAAVVREARRR